MKSFDLLVKIIVSLFVLRTESKEFCEAFKENGFKIDYFFSYKAYYEDTHIVNGILVIDHNYWPIVYSGGKKFQLKSKDGQISEFFESNHLMVFSVISDKKQYKYGFIKKDSSLEWHTISTSDDPLNFVKHFPSLHTDGNFLFVDSKPTVSFVYSFSDNIQSVTQDIVFMNQTLKDSSTNSYHRWYQRVNFHSGVADKSSHNLKPWKSTGMYYVLGVIDIKNKSILYGLEDQRIIFYSVLESIVSCIQTKYNSKGMDYIDNDIKKCKPEIVIDCHSSVDIIRIVVIVVIIVCIIVAIGLASLLCYYCFFREDSVIYKRKKKDKTRRQSK